MKVHEIILSSESIEEGWKNKLAAGAAAALMSTNPMFDVQPDPVKTVEPVQDEKEEIKPLTKKPNEIFLLQYAIEDGLSGDELAQFMAQCAHETGNFSTLEEYGSEDRFRRLYDIEFNEPNAKLLGNTKPGDGVRYIGRGYIQLTGKWNYSAAARALNIPLVSNPELLSNNKEVAAKVSLWYWKTRVRPKVSDFKNISQVTRTINRKLSGINDRAEKFKAYLDTVNSPAAENS